MELRTDSGGGAFVLDWLAAGAGVLSVFAFAPYQYFLLAPLSLLILFRTWRHASAGRAAVRGYLFGLGQFGVGTNWVFISMHDYSGADMLEASGLSAMFVAAFALYPALAGYLAGVCSPRKNSPLTLFLIFPAVWVGVEWIRGWFLTGFSWLQMGYSQIDNPIGQALAPIGGVYTVSLAVALLAASLLVAVSSETSRLGRFTSMLVVAAVTAGCYPLSKIQWVAPAGLPVSVALLQGNVSQQLKWRPESKQMTLEKYRELTRKNWDARLIVWPETAVPAFLHQVREGYLTELQAEASEHGTDVLIGVPVMNEETKRYYNGIVSLAPNGGVYYKRHMVPFGEYLPLRPFLGFVLEVLEIPLADFEPGPERQPLIRAAGYPFASSICFEDVFGYENRKGLPEAAFLVNATNDAWFGESIEPHQHLQMARMRALETGRYLLRTTNTGLTAIVSPNGQVVTQLPAFWEGALRGQFEPMKGTTPYVEYGDTPTVGVTMLMGLLGLLASRALMFRAAAATEHPG